MKITSLVENISYNENIGAEHGLSLYIETDRHKILFDMGQSDLFATNAKTLGINLAEVDIAILSHGHYDHGGGLKKFLEVNSKAVVYINQHAFEPHYNGAEKYIGLDISLKNNNRISFVEDELIIDEQLSLFSCNNHTKKFDLGSFGLNIMKDGELVPDDFKHEQYLLIKENGKKVLMSGCSHKGILNIAGWFDADVIIGGFHFSKLPLDEALVEYAKYLEQFEMAVYTCHCTGIEQYEFMKKYMSRLKYLSAGDSVEI